MFVAKAIVPDVLLPSHAAALGLLFYTGSQFPPAYRDSAFVALHGSINRSRLSGYSVVRVPFRILTKDEEKLLSKNFGSIKKQVDNAFKKKS